MALWFLNGCALRTARAWASVLALTGLLASRPGAAGAVPPTVSPTNRYEFRAEHDPNGIGKFHLGREIARVMGHQAAAWLERPERDEEEHSEKLVGQLNLRPGDVVADIGCGTGYFTRRLAEKVGAKGRVLAVDIQPEMLAILTNKMARLNLTNVQPVLGTVADPKLPAGRVDCVLMVDVYHEFEHPFEMMDAICRSLSPRGRVVFVEFRGEDPTVPIKAVHKMTEAQVKREMSIHPLEWVETLGVLPRQHIIIFRRKDSAAPPGPGPAQCPGCSSGRRPWRSPGGTRIENDTERGCRIH